MFEYSISFHQSTTDSNCPDLCTLLTTHSDPNSIVEFSDLLYNNSALIEAFFQALGEDGIFVAQVGESDEIDDPPESLDPDSQHFSAFLNGLQYAGFESLIDYDEAHGRLVEIWTFLLAMKDSESRSNWFVSEAEMQLIIQKRSMRTKNGESPFLYFDGASMMNYQFPSRVVEETWCREKSNECKGHGFDPEITSVPRSSFEVKQSAIALGGRGVFAKDFIQKGSFIGLEDCVHGMLLPSTTYDLMGESAEKFANMSDFWDVAYWGYVDGYGW